MSDTTLGLILLSFMSFLVLCPLIEMFGSELIVKIQDWCFKKAHPDWVEAYRAFLQSSEKIDTLERTRNNLKHKIDTLTSERGYIPSELAKILGNY